PIAPAGAVIATTAPAPVVSRADPAPPAAQPPTAQHPTPPGSSVPRQVSDATQTVADVTQPVTEPAAGVVQAVVADVTDAAGTVDAPAAVGTVETVASTAVATTTNAVATVAASASTIVPALPPLPPLTGGGLGGVRGSLRTRMDVGQRQVPPDVADVAELPEQLAHRRFGTPAVRALEVAVLDDRHRRLGRAAHVVPFRIHRLGEVDDRVGRSEQRADSEASRQHCRGAEHEPGQERRAERCGQHAELRLLELSAVKGMRRD